MKNINPLGMFDEHFLLETEVPAIKEREIPITPYFNFIYASGPVFSL
jgi:hypothetical protein